MRLLCVVSHNSRITDAFSLHVSSAILLVCSEKTIAEVAQAWYLSGIVCVCVCARACGECEGGGKKK